MSAHYPYGYSMAANVSNPHRSTRYHVPPILTRDLEQYEQGLEAAVPSQAGLEPAPQNFPELAQQPQPQQHYTYNNNWSQPSPYADSKLTPSPYSAHPHSAHPDALHPDVSPSTTYTAANLPPRVKAQKTVCGCSLLIFILSCII